MKRSLMGWVLLCTLSVTLAFGQIATTSLRGTIKDPSGALVPGATITITDNGTGKSSSTVANSDGLYAFPQIAPAKYTIRVMATGFDSRSRPLSCVPTVNRHIVDCRSSSRGLRAFVFTR